MVVFASERPNIFDEAMRSLTVQQCPRNDRELAVAQLLVSGNHRTSTADMFLGFFVSDANAR